MRRLNQPEDRYLSLPSSERIGRWSLDQSFDDWQVGRQTGLAASLLSLPVSAKGTTARFDTAGAGTLTTANSASLFPTTTDTAADDLSTTSTISVNGAHVASTIDAIGDQDFFKVELEAGETYEIGQYSLVAGPSGIPLADAYLELYDAAGNLVASADGGGHTPSGELYGLDALIAFSPQASGTYYVNARAYESNAADGSDKGDGVGDYELFVSTTTAPAYTSYYSPDSPLHSLDWGSQVDRTSRNPDGAEGPRVTGNPFTGTGWNPYGIEGKNVITYYFAKQGEVFIDENPLTPGTTDTMIAKGFEQWEKDAYLNAFGAYSQVADIVYVEVQDRTDADFVLITYLGTPGPGVSLLGRMSPPGEENEGRTEFNANDERWTEAGLAPGGFSFTTLIHELGHGHGMAHPHDDGGESGVMEGVDSGGINTPAGNIPDPTGLYPSYTNGDYDLNQSIYTMMSYEDGWEKSPYGQAETTDGFGWLGGLMAFDVAVIQDKYGVNEDWATGDDTYLLKDENAPGTFYSCIWDAGGTDCIVYEGARDANIDLRAATLKYEPGGGGWVSYAFGIHGGFTIANAVTIENASTGSGNDRLTGNEAANILSGGAGKDDLVGNGGDDTLIGGIGEDRLEGGAGRDLFRFDVLGDSAVGAARDDIVGFEQGSDLIDLSRIGAVTFIGNAAFSGAAGQVRYAAFDGTTIIELDQDGDRVADFQLELDDGLELRLDDFVALADIFGASNGNDVIRGTAGHDMLNGRGGDDLIEGLAGNDMLIGGGGADRLSGGAGSDRFVYESLSDSRSGAPDIITDFSRGSDRIDLQAIDANGTTAADDAFRFIGRSAFSGHAGELRYAIGTYGTAIQGDVDGDRLADFEIRLDDMMTMVAADFVI